MRPVGAKRCFECIYQYTFEKCKDCTEEDSNFERGDAVHHFATRPGKINKCMFYPLKEVACKRCNWYLQCILKNPEIRP
jgi:hypothetical protein